MTIVNIWQFIRMGIGLLIRLVMCMSVGRGGSFWICKWGMGFGEVERGEMGSEMI